jgi:hypothetical protein
MNVLLIYFSNFKSKQIKQNTHLKISTYLYFNKITSTFLSILMDDTENEKFLEVKEISKR